MNEELLGRFLCTIALQAPTILHKAVLTDTWACQEWTAMQAGMGRQVVEMTTLEIRSCKKKNISPNKVRNQTNAESYSLSTIDKALFEEVLHRECATKLKNLSLGHKDKNLKKITRNAWSPVRKGSFLLQPNSSTQKKEISDHSTDVRRRSTKSAANLKQPSKSSASQGKQLRLSVAIRDSTSNFRPVAQILSPGSTVLETPPFDTDKSSVQQVENLSTYCHNSDCCPMTNSLFWSFELPATLTDMDEDSASDLSDSERIPFVSTPCKPPDLKLRAEVIAPTELALSQTSSCLDFSYPDFLPQPYASWNLQELSLLVNSSSITKSPVTAQPLGLLESFVGRLLELEWLQLKTEEAERSKFIRPHSNTAPSSCISARNPRRVKKACLMVNKLLASPEDLGVGTVCRAASICSHCQLQYPYCNGTCRPYAYQNFSRSPSTKQHSAGSQRKAASQSKTRGKAVPFLSTKEVVLGRAPLENTPVCCAPTAIKAKLRKQPLHPVWCPTPSPYQVQCPTPFPYQVQCPTPSPRLCRTHQVTDTKKRGSMDESIVMEKGICLDNKTQRSSISNGKERQLHTPKIGKSC
ncbi:uncharacterized protein [Heterodontus francisci]|uniref:uncharacterized protein n=1 Tax=Heterodontus francisci TaxID=7792 RepID=UPI00355B46E0